MATLVSGIFGSGSSHKANSTTNSEKPVPPSKPPRRAEVEARAQVGLEYLQKCAVEKQALEAERQSLQQQNALLDKELEVIRQERAELQVQKAAALAILQESQEKRNQYLGNLKTMQRIINEQICIVNGFASTNPNKGQFLTVLKQLNQRGASIEPKILNGKFAEFLPELKSLQADLKEIRAKVSTAKA